MPTGCKTKTASKIALKIAVARVRHEARSVLALFKQHLYVALIYSHCNCALTAVPRHCFYCAFSVSQSTVPLPGSSVSTGSCLLPRETMALLHQTLTENHGNDIADILPDSQQATRWNVSYFILTRHRLKHASTDRRLKDFNICS